MPVYQKPLCETLCSAFTPNLVGASLRYIFCGCLPCSYLTKVKKND